MPAVTAIIIAASVGAAFKCKSQVTRASAAPAAGFAGLTLDRPNGWAQLEHCRLDATDLATDYVR